MSTATATRPSRARQGAARAARAPYAVGYDRLSRFRSDESAHEITCANDRQHNDNTAAALARDLGPIRQRFTDKGISASRFSTRERADWLALLDEVRSGRVTHVMIWVLDRIIRTDEDRVALLAACREGGAVIVQSGTGTVVDPNDPDSVFLATVLGAVAELEVAKMSMRHRRAKDEHAKSGVPSGGRRRFGYLDGNMHAHPVEAPIVREIAARILSGATLGSIARWLNDEGIPTASGLVGQWRIITIRAMMLKPSLAGLRVHRGEIVGRAAWDAILDETTFDAVVHILTRPERKAPGHSTARRYLLSGFAECSTCGAPLRGRPNHRGAEGYAYTCTTGRHTYRAGEPVDEVVEALVVERLSRLDASGALVDDGAADEARALAEDRRAVAGRLDALADDYADGVLSSEAYARAVARIEARLVDLDRAVGEASTRARQPLAVLDGMTGSAALAAWEGADLARRRALVELLFERVALVGASVGGREFRPEHVVVEWRVW